MVVNIGIDISLTIGERAGVGNYCYNLVKHLAKIDKKNTYVLFPFYYYIFHPDFKKAERPPNRNFRINLKKIPSNIIKTLWKSGFIPKKFFFPKVDILHSTTFCIPKKGYKKLVVTIYDLSFLTHPEFHLEDNVYHCHKGSLEAVQYADKIIAISENTKKDLVKYLHCDPRKIVVTYLGVDKRFKPIKNQNKIEEIKKKYDLSKRYIFTLSSIEPRKNISGLIESYARLPTGITDVYDLVIAGGKGWRNLDIYKRVRKSDFEKKVRFIEYVHDNDLPYLYNGATVFVYPSFYEGFGLPVLEAMTCGCPVISSNISSIPEVVGKAGILINPNNTYELRDSIQKLLENPKVQKRMSKRGLKQAKKFTWEKCAKQTYKIYEGLFLY